MTKFYTYLNERKMSFKKPNWKTIQKRLKMFSKKKKSKIKKTKEAFTPDKKYKNKLKNILYKVLKENHNMNESTEERMQALANFLEISVDEIEEVSGIRYEANDGEYLVLTDSEADEEAKEYIEQSIWAFQEWFLMDHIDVEDINNYLGFSDTYYDEDQEEDVDIGDADEVFFLYTGMTLEELVKDLQSNAESGNDQLREFVQASSGIDSFVDDAIGTDGRGHFLSPYDGEENEEGKYYIYRTN